VPESLALEAHTLATVVGARLDAHEKTCTERYGRIAGDTAEIKAAILALSTDLKGAVQRIHERIDNEALVARNDNKTVLAEAENAHGGIAGLKVWVLSGAGAILLAIVGWFADHFFGKTP
jgi:hypothetical protein